MLVALPGCTGKDRRSRSAPTVTRAPSSGYLDTERLLALHPDAARLKDLDRRMRRAREFPAPLPYHPLQAPAPLELTAPDPPAPAKPVSRQVNAERARTAVEEDFAIRRLARPEEEELRYRRTLERLRRRFLELRLEPRPVDSEDDLAEALRNARRFSELEEQLRSLRERPEDRLFYSPAQLNRRRDLFRLTQQELEELRQTEITRLERALDPTANRGRTPTGAERQIPPEALARAEQERKTSREEALAELARLEQAALQAAIDTELPAVAMPDQAVTAVPTAEELAEERETAAAKVARAEQGQISRPSAGAAASAADSLLALQKTRDEMRQRLLEEVRAAALSAARREGIVVTFTPGTAPDRTAQLAPAIVKLLSGRTRNGAR